MHFCRQLSSEQLTRRKSEMELAKIKMQNKFLQEENKTLGTKVKVNLSTLSNL